MINRCSTAGFVPPSVYIGFRLFVLLGRRGNVSSILWRVRGRLVSWANSSVGIQSCPTPPRHPAVRSVPTRQRYVRVLDSTGTNYIVRASEEMFRTVVFDTLVGTRNTCFLGEPNRRRPFRPSHAPFRPDPPVVCSGFGLGKLSDMIPYTQ